MREFPLYLNGHWKKTREILGVVNPATNKVFAYVCLGSELEIDAAVSAAHTAYQKMKMMKSFERSALCERISDLIQLRMPELVEAIILENGKPRKFAVAEVKRAVSTFKIASEEANRIEGEVQPLDITEFAKTKFGFWKRFPMGVVAAITPFNFPLNLVAHKIAPALACGNTVVLKPASKTPLSSLKLAEIIHDAGAPPGAVNVIPCRSELGMRLVKDSRVKVVSFTGSDVVGWKLKEAAPKKKVILELGGNAGVVVHEDADIASASSKLASSAFAYSGQVCIKTQRIYVHKKIFRRFVKQFLKDVKKLKVGDPRKEDTDLGAMIDEQNVKRAEAWVKEAVKNGAKVLLGGKRKGLTYLPTVLTRVPKEEKVCAQEVFAPVVVLEKYAAFQEALQQMNDTRFGLQAGIFTNDINLIMDAYEKIDAGAVLVNETPSFRVDNMPYGGIKDSGFGREGIRFAIEDMTEIKLLVLNLRR